MEASYNDQKQKKLILVLGAGVIGLTTALRLQETGIYQVEIVAEIFPTDPKSIGYTSQWAGAHHVSRSDSTFDLESPTFREMWKLSEHGSLGEHCFMRIREEEFFGHSTPDISVLSRLPNFRKLSDNELPAGAEAGYSCDALTINVPSYLSFLLSRFLEKGGTIIRGRIQHLSQVLERGAYPFKDINQIQRNVPVSPPDAVVVSLGLGARFLGGIEDQDVYPARGQTVILRAPWIKFGRSFQDDIAHTWVYVIPRSSGDVVIGGTLGNDWYPKARQETTHEILERALRLCPELVPPEQTSSTSSPRVDDLKGIIIEEACGLRPMRKGGPRIELDYHQTPKGIRVPVVYNYGHGPYGYMASIGSADKVLTLLRTNSALWSDGGTTPQMET